MVEKLFNFSKLEKKWQKKWEESKAFEVKADSKKKKFYVLDMYPYPSAYGLHMGHALNYTVGDIYARYKRMNGFNVLYPMGFDSFGLPAENAAIKAKSHPKKFTEEAIKNYIKQMKSLGLSYDWSRMIETHKPEYYKWDQWLFLKMFEKGLAYRKKAPVNWCDKCKTVLANEQVVNGKCWRHEDVDVKVKYLEQWFYKTTEYADELYEKLNELDGWPETIRSMQKNWIGKSQGTEVDFIVNGKVWSVFTTRPDTLFGVSFLVISAQHPDLMELVTKDMKKDVEIFLKGVKSTKEEDKDRVEKEGVFTGSYAKHPLTGENVPIWAGNFVVADYGSGMVMGVPAHDQRDFEFAKKYGLEIKQVVRPEGKFVETFEESKAFEDFGILINSSGFDGLKSREAKEHITGILESESKGRRKTAFRLRDWLISRQRFWGCPIPVVYCDNCGIVPIPEKDLPVKLPENIKLVSSENPLKEASNFVNVNCPKCSGKAKRETDTMDTFVDSSWYFLRYTDSHNEKKIFDSKKARYWMPIDQYIGGKEHTTGHLIYFRFLTKVIRDMGLLEIDEPALNLFNQGMLHGSDGRKMSKSYGNVIVPEKVSEKYGFDTARLFLVSVASPDKDIEWSNNGIEGSLKFILRVLDYFSKVKIGKSSRKLEHNLNKGIKKIGNYIETMKYNLAVIDLRNVFYIMESENEVTKKDIESFVKVLSIFCPHIAEELWENIKGKGLVSVSIWPKYDGSKIDENIDLAEKSLEKTIDDIRNILKIMKEKQDKEGQKVYVYVLPGEIEYYDVEKLNESLSVPVEVYAVNDKNKFDPENKSSKAKPGKPGIYVE